MKLTLLFAILMCANTTVMANKITKEQWLGNFNASGKCMSLMSGESKASKSKASKTKVKSTQHYYLKINSDVRMYLLDTKTSLQPKQLEQIMNACNQRQTVAIKFSINADNTRQKIMAIKVI